MEKIPAPPNTLRSWYIYIYSLHSKVAKVFTLYIGKWKKYVGQSKSVDLTILHENNNIL